MSDFRFTDFLSLAPEVLIDAVDEVPLSYRKFFAAYYPDARVRRVFLKSIGVVFEDDSSFVNMGFCVTPNSPSDVHVYIGKNVSVGPNVTCVCDSCANNGDGINGFAYVRDKLTKRESIKIGNESWIGANVVVLPGADIADFCVIGAGSVVVKPTEEYGIYAGVPARKIGDVRCWEEDVEQ